MFPAVGIGIANGAGSASAGIPNTHSPAAKPGFRRAALRQHYLVEITEQAGCKRRRPKARNHSDSSTRYLSSPPRSICRTMASPDLTLRRACFKPAKSCTGVPLMA